MLNVILISVVAPSKLPGGSVGEEIEADGDKNDNHDLRPMLKKRQLPSLLEK
jgi:hypothetical protein